MNSSQPPADETYLALTRAARAAWPGIDVPEDAFVELLAARTAGPDARPLAELPAAELWLALGCARGDPKALHAFEEHTFPRARSKLRRMGLPPDTIAEVLQTLRERLLVARAGREPRILAAATHGNLPAQIRVAAVRLALNLRRRDHRLELTDTPILRALAPDADPELAALEAEQQRAVKAALQDAIGSLTHKERCVLRMHFVHGLSIDAIGQSYRVHRATVARWLQTIRARLAHESRRLLRERQGLEEAEVDSLLRLVEGHLEISFLRLLRSTGSVSE